MNKKSKTRTLKQNNKTRHRKTHDIITPQRKSIKNRIDTKKLLRLASGVFLTIAVLASIIFFNLLLIRTFPVPKNQTLAASDQKHIQPTEIIIRDLVIDLPIYPAYFHNGTFDTTTQGASYLASTPLPGQKGNSIIYAHNWSNLFGNLYNVQTGEKIDIIFSDKSHKTFTVASTQTVPANQIDILNPTNDNRLTLFTCANFLDADRFVVTAMADK